MVQSPTFAMSNGNLFKGEKISELTETVITTLAESKLTYTEAKIVLNRALEVLGDYCSLESISPIKIISRKE